MSESPRRRESAEDVGTSGANNAEDGAGRARSSTPEAQQEKVLEALAKYLKENDVPASVRTGPSKAPSLLLQQHN